VSYTAIDTVASAHVHNTGSNLYTRLYHNTSTIVEIVSELGKETVKTIAVATRAS
jgi:hypothetical protein